MKILVLIVMILILMAMTAYGTLVFGVDDVASTTVIPTTSTPQNDIIELRNRLDMLEKNTGVSTNRTHLKSLDSRIDELENYIEKQRRVILLNY